MKRSIDIAIDPGKHSAAFSLWEEQQLIYAGFVEIQASPRCHPHIVAATLSTKLLEINGGVALRMGVIERPRTYETRFQKGDQADIHDVSLVAGACSVVLATFGAAVSLVYPAEWKGQIKKNVTKNRVERELSAAEFETVVWPHRASKKHNVYDAVHLGLRSLTRRHA
jgi:hypothetical protein